MTTPELEKRAAWSRLYVFDFSPFVELALGATLSSPSVSSDTVGLTIGTPVVSGQTIQVRISGGTAGTTYTLTATATTSGGDTLTVVGSLSVIA